MTDISRIRKRPLEADPAASGRAANEIDIAACATISYSSEDPDHPVEHLSTDIPARGPPVGLARAPTPSSMSS